MLILNCTYNPFLSSLPLLPNSIQILDCQGDSLTSLPALPDSVQWFFCNGNFITNIPALPSKISRLSCDHNNITVLPALPSSLKYLVCGANLFTSLPALPDSLLTLSISGSALTSIPALPNTLTFLDCSAGFITSLPALPNSITDLRCTFNQLTSLPTLPNGLAVFRCSHNAISCFPVIPNTLTTPSWFDISNNPFACLPNYVPAMSSANLSVPLCVAGDVINNPYGCNGSQGILGFTYVDNNGNCLFNNGDSAKINIPEKLFDSGNNLIAQTVSALNGVYDFPQPSGIYTVSIDTAAMPYLVQCVNPGTDSVVQIPSLNPIVSNINFSVACKPGFDVGVQSIQRHGFVFPGQQHWLNLLAGDLSNWYNLHCASGVSGQLVITVTGPVTYVSPSPGALTPTVAGNVFTYNVPDFGATNVVASFGLIMSTNISAQNGDAICVNVTVTPTAGDNNTANNTFNYCYTVVNSWDPNYKETYPEQVQPGFTDYFYYTVHFQNTGSASAINIQLQDTLDSNLDLNTLQVINYSHYNTTWLTGNKLSFNFPNIQLPDSTSNFDGSQGYVQYRIKPLANLPAGTLIHNKASIYFDYNAPVVTNTTTNEFMLNVGQSHISHLISQVFIYPNPSNGKFSISFSEEQKHTTIKVTNLLGECIEQLTTNNKQLILDLSSFANGIYFVKIEDENQNINYRKIVKE